MSKVINRREECKLSNLKVSRLIDIIFDDFESRTCKNCNHYQLIIPENNPHDQYNYFDCCANDKAQNIVSSPPSTFGCNKFERQIALNK